MTGKSIRLSLCIGTYARAKFIGETLDSMLRQLPADVEVVVFDGASPDDTPKILSQYVSRHPKIRYYREEENSGLERGFDKVVGYATGEYCWLLSDDDLLKPGAIARVLRALDAKPDLLVVNAEVRNVDFSRMLNPQMFRIPEDRTYGAKELEEFFSTATPYLGFVGGIIIRRSLWLERERSPYLDTMFLHVGVIFQRPLEKITVIADPLIVIRYGNGSWTARSFEIWMFKWPQLIWSFNFSDEAKQRLFPREPWRNVRKLIYFRALGAYSTNEYRRFIADNVTGASRFASFAAAVIPKTPVNFFMTLYFIVKRTDPVSLYALAHCPHTVWPADLIDRIFPAVEPP